MRFPTSGRVVGPGRHLCCLFFCIMYQTKTSRLPEMARSVYSWSDGDPPFKGIATAFKTEMIIIKPVRPSTSGDLKGFYKGPICKLEQKGIDITFFRLCRYSIQLIISISKTDYEADYF